MRGITWAHCALCFSTGRYVLSGSHDGSVLVWDTNEEAQSSEDSTEPFLHPILPYKAHEDTVNGIRCDHLSTSLNTSIIMRFYSWVLHFWHNCRSSCFSRKFRMCYFGIFRMFKATPFIVELVWKGIKFVEIWRFPMTFNLAVLLQRPITH